MKSYGAMTVTLQFLDPLEQLKMQVLSKYWYKVAISRVQTAYRRVKKEVFYLKLRVGSKARLCAVEVDHHYKTTMAASASG